MRIIVHISIFVAVCMTGLASFVSCKSNSKDKDELLRIEQLNETDPKAALHLLDSIENVKNYNNTELKALYSLVKSQALDKNYIDVADDSLISVAREYYENSSDKYHRMKSEYYSGIVYLNADTLDIALNAFLKAYDIAEERKEYFWQGMTASKMADIFTRNCDGVQALEFAKISLRCLNKSNDATYVNYALLDLATAYHNINYSDSCIYIIEELLSDSITAHDPWLDYSSKELIGAAYIQNGEYNKAIDVLQDNSKPDGGESVTPAYVALAYLELGDIDKGKEIIESLSDSSTLISDYLKFELYDKLNYKNEALKTLKKSYDKSCNNHTKRLTSKLSIALLKYHKTEKKLDKANITKYKYRIAYIITASILVISIIILIFLYRSQKQKLRNQELVESAKYLKERLNDTSESNKRLAKSVYSLLSTQFANVNDACQTLYECENEDKAKKQIAQNMLKLINHISEDENTIKQLEELLDYHCKDIYSNLKNFFPDLKIEDYRLFLYSALGFDNLAISKFFRTTVKGVYGRRDRMKNRILNSDIENKETYIAILYPQGLKHKPGGNIGQNQNLYRPNLIISD